MTIFGAFIAGVIVAYLAVLFAIALARAARSGDDK